MRITTWAEYGVICSQHLARRRGEGPVTWRDRMAELLQDEPDVRRRVGLPVLRA